MSTCWLTSVATRGKQVQTGSNRTWLASPNERIDRDTKRRIGIKVWHSRVGIAVEADSGATIPDPRNPASDRRCTQSQLSETQSE